MSGVGPPGKLERLLPLLLAHLPQLRREAVVLLVPRVKDGVAAAHNLLKLLVRHQHQLVDAENLEAGGRGEGGREGGKGGGEGGRNKGREQRRRKENHCLRTPPPHHGCFNVDIYWIISAYRKC